jgi:hypothetical protein
VGAKLSCWRALGELGDARLHDVGLPALIERAERQRDELERFRLASAREVLSKRG